MADKKRRLEQDPSIDPKTGKKRERRLKDDKPSITVDIDGVPLGDFSKRLNEAAAKMASSYVFDAKQISKLKESMSGGNIFIEGGDGRARPWVGGGGPANTGHLMGRLMDFINQYGVPRHLMGEGMNFREAVAQMLHTKAIECWEGILGWQFAVTYNEGQATFWFTARYYDEEAGEALVTETLEFSEEQLEYDNWDESVLDVERQMQKFQEKCNAEKAMFDD